ncbi:hypothetical protein StoSoilB3_19130 [Arthrobacter sp. StoSoilB3]|nr:hypothetical protein NtRootA2_18020 [Arthrobacter sp. NtRootA2]BCW14602.1 hypothetical protein NtRootA4_15810 [Arthrobacter sp. NtRootA4]BCW22937.1 hypothetical protein NtRootC7_18040 [Arthrobacter sp. NtRootC7]BCW27206.1 hypothetical protein NtRootC45_18060 [Arthrobacter sp. NtRootC45]BCW31473.1 hypothetical protein NtRootD5_18040 [Arthrobacter sp. NtRootD5]BCW40378.1 hypothetical protein StoSoilB3_19130 [Arthrobacter sp. StoSoilB3]
MLQLEAPQERKGSEAHHCEAGGRQHSENSCGQGVKGKVRANSAQERRRRRNRFASAKSNQQDAGKGGETPTKWPLPRSEDFRCIPTSTKESDGDTSLRE